MGTTTDGPPTPHRARRVSRWRTWRHSRPFWGGLLVTLGAVEILVSVRAPLPVILHVGLQGLAAYLVPVLLLLCGLLLLFNPSQRVFYSILSIVLSLASWLTSNLGGFLIGLLLGLTGGALAFAWTAHRPGPVPAAGRADTEGPTASGTEPGNTTEPGSRPGPGNTTGPEGSTVPEPAATADPGPVTGPAR
ncbi:DUF6114 domain-containing protein [Micromonospora echinofusca]|uniref:DUF6114 domain-containing protein n=1 Tax=Micromonospora echinofusca TaxID=47858 RepID=UPI001AD67DE2|nr:DUF6114 domain-containing protein [Micromonospora echinofusca]